MLKLLKRSFHLVIALVCSAALFLAGAFIVPQPIDVAASDADFTKVTFRNFNLADGTYTKAENTEAVGQMTENLDKKFFVGNVKLSKDATIYIGGTAAEKGLSFAISGARLSVKFDTTTVGTFTKAKAGLTNFENTEFTLGVSFEKVGTKLKLGIYFNGNLYDDKYFEVNNAASKLGETLSIVCKNSGSVTIKSDNSAQVLPDATFDWLTTDHFYIADGVYGYTDGIAAAKGTYILNLNRTYFTADVKFSGVEGASVRYGGQEKDGGLSGFMFSLKDSKLVMSDAITGTNQAVEFVAADAGLTSFADTQFKLGISTEFVDADLDGKEDDVKLGVWFNDTLYKNEFLAFVDYASKIGSTMGVISTVEGSTVEIGKVEELSVTMPDPTLKRITAYEHFGMADKTYTGFNPSSKYNKGFDNTYFSAYLTYTDGANLYILSDDSGWAGIAFAYSKGNLVIKTTGNGATVATLKADVAGVDFGKKFRIGVATTFIDADNDGNKNDVNLGVYFNEDLYNDEFFVVKDYLTDRDNKKITAYAPSSNLTIGSIAEFKDPVVSRPLDSSFNKITFETVAIENGKYVNNPDSPAALAAKGAYSKEFDGTAFGGTVKFSKKGGAQLGFGMDGTGWVGFRCKIDSNGNFFIDDSAGIAPTMTFNASRAGLESFVENAFDLTLTTRYVDSDSDGEKDDIELGVWFNDVLYNDEFIYIKDRVAKMGKVVAIYCPADTWIEVNTRAEFIPVIIPEQLDKGYTLITFGDFGLPNTTYEKSGLVGNGKYLKTLDNTYFSGYLKYMNGITTVLNYAGAGDAWTGMGITVTDKQITVKDNSGRTDTYYFTAKRANIDSFTEKDIKLGVTTDYLDLDGDGAEDDVKFGIWVNDYLCNNEYIEIIDYRQYIGNEKAGIGAGLGIYNKSMGEEENGKLKIQSIKIPVDIERFGFTLNWARELNVYANTTTQSPSTSKPTQSPQTGDGAKMLNAMIFSCVALGGIMNIDQKRR